MRAASLFSGIGAPECARPDWQWLWHAEIEPFPAAVMQARHPGSLNLGNVLADDFAERAERPDILVFGSPCQSFSVAGKRLGLSDPRGNLALVALALVRRLRPSWFIFENVPGLLSSERGEDYETFLGAVAESGYSGCWRVLDARYWHLAQRRERVFFVGSFGDWRGPAAVLSLAEGMRGYPEKGREAGKNIAPTLAARTRGGGGLGTDFDCDGRLVSHALRAEGFDASEDGTGRDTPLVPVIAPTLSFGAHPGGVTGREAENGSLIVAQAFDARQSDVIQYGDMSDTDGHTMAVAMNLRGREGGAMPEMADVASLRSASGGSSRSYVASMQVRRLTPRECERLQGFPDDFTAIDWRGKPAADGPRYRSLGNSMAVPVLRWLLTRIEAYEQVRSVAA